VAKLFSDMKEHGRSPLLDNCQDSNLEIFACHFENRKTSNSKKLMGKLVELEKMKREKQLLTMKGFSHFFDIYNNIVVPLFLKEGNGTGIVTLASDSDGCRQTNAACAGAGIGCSVVGFFGPIGPVFAATCGVVTGVGCLAANIVQDCF
jgi:hypothetical protein